MYRTLTYVVDGVFLGHVFRYASHDVDGIVFGEQVTS